MLGLSSIFLFNYFLHVFCNSTKTSANSSVRRSENGYYLDSFFGVYQEKYLKANFRGIFSCLFRIGNFYCFLPLLLHIPPHALQWGNLWSGIPSNNISKNILRNFTHKQYYLRNYPKHSENKILYVYIFMRLDQIWKRFSFFKELFI